MKKCLMSPCSCSQFELEDLRVMSLQSIRNLNLFATLAVGYIGLTTAVHEGFKYFIIADFET